MAEMIAFQEEICHDMERGLNLLADTARVTLGPRGHNMMLEKKWGAPMITNGDISIAKGIDLADPYEKAGTGLVREVVKKTDDMTGDGTTTTTVLTQAIVKEGLRNVAIGASPIVLRHGIGKAVNAMVERLIVDVIEVSTEDQVAVTAPTSAANEAIGEMIVEAMEEVGEEGAITVEGPNIFGLNPEVTEGICFDRGYISPYFVTDADRQEAVLEDTYILLVDHKISTIKDLVPLLEKIMQAGKSLVIVAEGVDGEALATLVINRIRGASKAVAVKAPGFGDRHKATLQDMAILTGGQVVFGDAGLKLESVGIEVFDTARKVIITEDDTTVVDGGGNKEPLAAYIKQIRTEIEKTDFDYDCEELQERLAELAGGVAVIKSGAATEVELKERRQCIGDAVRNAKATKGGGLVPGGEVALIQAAKEAFSTLRLKGDKVIDVSIIEVAIEAPSKQVATSAGLEGGVVTEKVRNLPKGQEPNAAIGVYEDLLAAKMTDPVKVIRSALQNATSIASLLLTTEAVVADKPGPPAPVPTVGGDDMGGTY